MPQSYKKALMGIVNFVLVKKLFSILSLALTAVLLFATAGFSVSRHYCMGMLVEESFYNPPHECGSFSDDHCGTEDMHLSSNCCEDENLVLEGIEIQNFDEDQTLVELPALPVAYLLVNASSKQNFSTVHPYRANAPPPLIRSGRSILISVQRFLI